MRRRGFTLIELLVVIGIIGLLSTIVSVALGNARLKARDIRRMSDLKQLQTALELYYGDVSAYPAGTSVNLGDATHNCLDNSAAGFVAKAACGAVQYMGSVPTDPQSGYYVYTAASSTYTVNATLEGTVGALGGAIKLTPAGIGQ